MNKETKCLLLRTQDNRQFFTHTEYLPQLVEFSNTFGAEMSIVQAKSTNLPLMDLEYLAPAICSPNYTAPENIQIEVLETVRPDNINFDLETFVATQSPTKTKKEKKQQKTPELTPVQKAQTIRDHIRKTFLKGDVVDLKKVTEKFSYYHFRLYTYAAHIKHVRDHLMLEGKEIQKISAGRYKMIK